jgi:hypothetical protein
MEGKLTCYLKKSKTSGASGGRGSELNKVVRIVNRTVIPI